jgi:hypothetical protein
MRPIGIAALAMAFAAALPACSGDDKASKSGRGGAPEGAFVGTVKGSDAYVALVSNGDELVAGYLCDGKTVSTWLERSRVQDGRAELRDREGARVGEVELERGGASGEVEVGGRSLAFSAVPDVGGAGLYRETAGGPGEPGFTETGWIVLADGSARGATTKFIDQESDFLVEPAPPRGSGATKVTPGFTESGTDI